MKKIIQFFTATFLLIGFNQVWARNLSETIEVPANTSLTADHFRRVELKCWQDKVKKLSKSIWEENDIERFPYGTISITAGVGIRHKSNDKDDSWVAIQYQDYIKRLAVALSNPPSSSNMETSDLENPLKSDVTLRSNETDIPSIGTTGKTEETTYDEWGRAANKPKFHITEVRLYDTHSPKKLSFTNSATGAEISKLKMDLNDVADCLTEGVEKLIQIHTK